ncbi:MAG: ABC transporter ATP-binding protein, partial [Thermofilaceae archaeon]
MLLAVENLKMYYGVDGETVKAVDGVDFSLGEAESLGIVGESGCGKSSLAMTLLKILPSNARIVSGRIVLDGMDIVGLPEDKLRREIRWRKVSMVFQGSMNALNPVIKVGEQIAEAIIVHVDGIAKKEALEKAADLLEMVGLDRSTLKRYPFELSGGQRQRAVIAMALALNPRVLIADEPTTALDVIVQAQILKLLKELKERLRLSIVFISHDVSVISEVSNKVAIMYAGKFVESGSTEAVFLNPSHPYT